MPRSLRAAIYAGVALLLAVGSFVAVGRLIG
jgi:xanthine/uracil/vitamin C permease (AzgA family)